MRYWEKQFTTLAPIKRNGRRYFTCQDILVARQIRELLYVENFTIEGAKAQLQLQNKVKNINKNNNELIHDALIKLKKVVETLK